MKFLVKKAFHIHVNRITKLIPAGEYETTEAAMVRALKNCQEAVEIKPPPPSRGKKAGDE